MTFMCIKTIKEKEGISLKESSGREWEEMGRDEGIM